MEKRIVVVLISALFLVNSIIAADLGVIPTPRKIGFTQESLLLSDLTRIIASPKLTEKGWFAITQFQNSLRERKGLNIDITGKPSFGSLNTILIGNPEEDKMVAARMKEYGLSITPEMEKEGYVLGIGKNGVIIGAVSDAGILYGLITLKQIILACPGSIYSKDIQLPGVKIHDWPALEMRGIHDDVARGQVSTVENYKDMIRTLAEFKMNTLMLYMEELFRFKAYPEIGVGRGAFTKAEVDELEAYAKPYNVEIIPVFQLLDHMSDILIKEEHLPLAEFPGAGCLRICDETYEFLENCINELADAFDSKYFHAGLDESWDLGTGRSKTLVDSLGRGIVHARHYIKVHDLLAKYGKKMLFYNWISLEHPEILDLIPKDIIHIYYNYGARDSFPGITKAAEAGFKFGIHPGLSNWRRFFPTMSQAVVNIRNLTLEAVKNNAWGTAVCSWGDEGGKNFRELLYYGYAYQGEVAWSPETTDTESFGENFFNLWNGMGTAPYFETIYTLLEKWPPGWNKGRPILPYFRHPFLPLNSNYNLSPKELYEIQNDAEDALSLIATVRALVKYRKGDLDYLEFCAQTHQNFMQSIKLVNDLNNFNNLSFSQKDLQIEKTNFIERIYTHRNDLVGLRDKFESLWLRTNLPANLQYNINDYNRLIKVWDDVGKRVEEGKIAYNPLTPANWIYHPDGFIKNVPIKVAYFRKTFDNPDTINSAHIQVIGDTHIKLFVNNKLLGEQVARRSVIEREDATMKLYDITPYLKEGENVIAIEAHNYLSGSPFREPGGPKGCAGFHMYGEITDQNNDIKLILSDSSWKVSKIGEDGWKRPGFNDKGWGNAMGDQHPLRLVTYPDFSKNKRGFADKK